MRCAIIIKLRIDYWSLIIDNLYIMKKTGWLMGLLIVVLFALNLLMGSVSIPAAEVVNILTGGEAAKAS